MIEPTFQTSLLLSCCLTTSKGDLIFLVLTRNGLSKDCETPFCEHSWWILELTPVLYFSCIWLGNGAALKPLWNCNFFHSLGKVPSPDAAPALFERRALQTFRSCVIAREAHVTLQPVCPIPLDDFGETPLRFSKSGAVHNRCHSDVSNTGAASNSPIECQVDWLQLVDYNLQKWLLSAWSWNSTIRKLTILNRLIITLSVNRELDKDTCRLWNLQVLFHAAFCLYLSFNRYKIWCLQIHTYCPHCLTTAIRQTFQKYRHLMTDVSVVCSVWRDAISCSSLVSIPAAKIVLRKLNLVLSVHFAICRSVKNLLDCLDPAFDDFPNVACAVDFTVLTNRKFSRFIIAESLGMQNLQIVTLLGMNFF